MPLSSANTYDLLVIGGGSGGVRAARRASGLGARVALFDPEPLGGTCVNAGCVPKKLLWYAANFASELHDAGGYGWQIPSPTFSWAELIRNKDRAIDRLNSYYDQLLHDAGVTVIRSHVRFIDAGSVCTQDGRLITGRHVIIATGARPLRPTFSGWQLGICSDEAFHLQDLPRRTVIVGGGYIGVEFAGIFNRLGSQTVLVHRGDTVLRDFDMSCVSFLMDQMRLQGMTLQMNTQVTGLRRVGTELMATLSDGTELYCDALLYAIGRTPNTKTLNLAAAGIDVDARGAICIDANYRTTAASVYALGDVTDRLQLTPVALAEAESVIGLLFGKGAHPVDYTRIPTAVFSTPNLATVGLTEAQARAQGLTIKAYVKNFSPLLHMLTGSKERVFMKVIAEDSSGRIIGVHMVGHNAPEIVQGLAIAMQAGLTKQTLDLTLGIHPTTAEEWVSMHTVG